MSRCDTCKHWQREPVSRHRPVSTAGYCGLIDSDRNAEDDGAEATTCCCSGGLRTREDFGCALHEVKP